MSAFPGLITIQVHNYVHVVVVMFIIEKRIILIIYCFHLDEKNNYSTWQSMKLYFFTFLINKFSTDFPNNLVELMVREKNQALVHYSLPSP